MKNAFDRFAKVVSTFMGHPITFAIALAIIILWAISGPIFHFTDSWQLLINTSTTIVTFLMVFLIQNTQNRGDAAIQLKLDELLRAIESAKTEYVDLEDLPEKDMQRIKTRYNKIAEQERKFQKED